MLHNPPGARDETSMARFSLPFLPVPVPVLCRRPQAHLALHAAVRRPEPLREASKGGSNARSADCRRGERSHTGALT